MTATKFMAIYSSAKKMLRRKVLFAYAYRRMEWWMHDEDYLDPKWVLPGEDFVLVDIDYYWQGHDVLHAAIDMAIYKKHGVYAILPGDLSGRCAVINQHTLRVDRIIMADDELDVIDGYILVNNPIATQGDVYDCKTNTFRKPLHLIAHRKVLMASVSKLRVAA
jgi:hypothetical protein